MNGDVRRSLSSKERISLRLWVFKFIHYEDADFFGVSVEGYRPNDQTETILRNWHSTAIEERISSSLLRSRSGSIYELRGCIDKELAHQYGYPAELVSMFTNGFPRNWKHVLKKFSDAVRATIPLITSQNFSTFGRRLPLDSLRESNQAVQLSAGISILAPSVTLPDVTEELESEKKESTFHEAIVQPMKKLQSSTILADGTDAVNSAKDMVSNETNFGGQDTSHRNTSGGSVVSLSEFVQYAAGSMHSSNLSIHHHAEDPIPLVQSPRSLSSQSLNQDLSAGPVYNEPYSSDETSRRGDVERKSSSAVTPRNAILPRFYDVPHFQAPQLSRCNSNDAIELSEWSIRFAPIGYRNPALGFPAFVILGSKEDHPAQWQTSIVTRVESAQIFHTMSTKYRLIGEMNAVDSASAGFPKMFVSKFLRGFPPDWRTAITELYNSFFLHLERTARSVNRPERGSRAESSYSVNFGRKLQSHCYERNLHSPRGNGSTIQSHISDISPGNFSKETMMTDVRRSRSGRCVHAPLAQWAGQRIRYDGLGNVIGVQDVTNVTMHSRRATNTSDLCSYYGMSSNENTMKRSRSAAKVRKVSGDCCSEKPPRKQAFRTCNASTNDVVKSHRGKAIASSYGDRRDIESRALHVVQDESDDSSFEQKLRLKRRLILNKARELQKQQEELLNLERRIANEEKNCRRNWTAGKRLVSQVEESWSNHPEVGGRWNLSEVKGRVSQRKRGKRLLYNVDGGNEASWEDGGEQRCFEEEWVRENMELCSESDDSEDKWSEKVQKKRNIPAKRRKKRLLSSGVSLVSDEISDGENEEDPAVYGGEESCVKFPVRKERRWHKAELQRLKLALAAIHVGSEDDWEKVSRSLGGGRDAESCKQAAIKRLKWKPTYPNNSPVPEITSEFVTARAGTIAHHHQTNEYTRKFMMGGSVQGEDYFNQNTTTMSNSIPDVTEFGADDSLLEAIITPEDGVDKMKRTIRRQFFAEPLEDDTPPRRQSSGIHRVTPTDSAQRERQSRYCHHILSKGGRGKGISRMNFSHVDELTCLERTRDEQRSRNVHTFGDLHENLEKVAKITQNVARRRVDWNGSSFHSDLEGSDFDDNLEDSL